MRGYFFTNNVYMSQIQLGIQAAHCATTMFAEAVERGIDTECFSMMQTYATQFKTKIILAGGNCQSLQNIYNRIVDSARFSYQYENFANCSLTCSFDEYLAEYYPFAKFHEDEESLNGALTCVGIVVPQAIYEFAARLRAREYEVVNTGETIADIGVYKNANGVKTQVSTLMDMGMINSDIALAQLIAESRLA